MKTTAQALAAITDQGRFELLATAILRESNPIYRSLCHPGVNAAGKTVKSPLDGVCFVSGANPPHMIAVHHTTNASDGLNIKWLHDPSKVKPRKGSKPTAPAGDLIKTAALVAEERSRIPGLRATLVLTTNEEPGVDLIRDIETAGRDHGLELDLWPRSRLSHFLDTSPTGQWLRHSYLGISQEQLSPELLYELSKKSLEIHTPPDGPTAWVPRLLDTTLISGLPGDVTFLVAGSGLGKSVACYRRLAAHVETGGFGLVIPHEVIASAITLEQAVMKALHQIHPALALAGQSVFSFCSPEKPILLWVEDVNRSGQAALLAEKLASWSLSSARKDSKGGGAPWHLICPLWPEFLASLDNQTRKSIAPFVITASGFTEKEGREAVIARARLEGRVLSASSADAVSRGLGHDPLLIALHDQHTTPDPHKVIEQFVATSLTRVAAETKDHPSTDYHQAIRLLASAMLTNRSLEPFWNEIIVWPDIRGELTKLITRLAHDGKLMRFAGSSSNQRLTFRHDRVRDWLLADTAGDLEQRGQLPDQVVADPFFAEVMGAALDWANPTQTFLDRVVESNPLALFHALRLLGTPKTPHHNAILQSINDMLDKPEIHSPSNRHLCWEALAMLAETDSPAVPKLAQKLGGQTTSGQLARLRNGDVSGGVELCAYLEPGTGAPWRDVQIEHAKLHHGHNLTQALQVILRRPDLGSAAKMGALRLAGHIADPRLVLGIETCWNNDQERDSHLEDYLWAFAECCGEEPERYLGPVCDTWASLPDQGANEALPSPRFAVTEHHLRWAFRKWPPSGAINYFVERAAQDDLRWPIIWMLHGMDHPQALLFVVQYLAEISRRLAGTNSFSFFVSDAQRDWRKAQDDGHPMSKASRDLLLEVWQDTSNDKYLRTQALLFWAATHDSVDLDILRASQEDDELADDILRQRLKRGDLQAIPRMVEKLASDNYGQWWQCGRYLWSKELTDTLDQWFDKRRANTSQEWGESFESDWITSELVMRLPEDEAEGLLLNHWKHLCYSHQFVQSALYVATPNLLQAVSAAVHECPEPSALFQHLSMHYGIKRAGHPGLINEAQIRALAPYLRFLSPMDVGSLWEACNDHGWFDIRREFLDERLQAPFLHRKWDRDQAAGELDKMIVENRLVWIDRWIDEFMRTGVQWPEILAVMAAWLDERRSLDALRVVAAAIERRGTREDLVLLRIYDGMPELASNQLIEDIQFAVCRRSIR